jgi:hypothetical protein
MEFITRPTHTGAAVRAREREREKENTQTHGYERERERQRRTERKREVIRNGINGGSRVSRGNGLRWPMMDICCWRTHLHDFEVHTTHRGSSNFGYPDETYFDRVKDELDQKGVR